MRWYPQACELEDKDDLEADRRQKIDKRVACK